MRTQHVQKIGRLLRRQLRVHGHDRHRVAVPDRPRERSVWPAILVRRPDCRPGNEMTYQDHIVRDARICNGQPVVRGTRVLVRAVLGYLAHGEAIGTILKEFPSISEEDVRAVIAFAAASAAEDLPAPSPIPPDVRVA